MFTLENTKEFQDEYLLEQVNCLEKPLLISLRNYDEVYYHLVLLISKMIQAYEIKKYHNNIIYIRTLNRLQIILKEEFSINFGCEINPNDISKFIKLQLDSNNPVLLPVNLYDLYYSEHYKENDWVHAFLLYNYNENKNLFYIIDSIQQNNNGYQKFCITKSMLEGLYLSLNNKIYPYNYEGIYYIESNTVKENLDNYEIVILVEKFLSYLCDSNLKNKCRVLNALSNPINFYKNENDTLSKNILGFIKYKEVFYNELEWIIKYLNVDNNIINKFCDIRNLLISEWKIISNKLVYYIYRCNLNKVNKVLEKVNDLEERMFDNLLILQSELKHPNFISKRLFVDYYLENNDDKIITVKNDRTFVFEFNNKRLYDNWIDDCAPKVNLTEIDFSRSEVICVSTKLKLLNNINTANYMAGFHIKTKNNSRYMCGANSGLCISMDHSGVNTSIFAVDKCPLYLEIKLRIINNIVSIECLDVEKDERFVCEDIVLDSKVCEIGLSCKTWGYNHPIKVVFDGLLIS